MKADYVHKDSTTLIQDELVKNELNQIELQYNALKQQKFNELLKENQELERQIEIKNEYLVFILDLTYDYDGFNTVGGLKGLIDELRIYAGYALEGNDKVPIYRDGNGNSLNILHEKIGE